MNTLPKTKTMNTEIEQPMNLTAEDPIAAFKSAVPQLIECMQHQSEVSDLIRGMVWSLWNSRPVSLNRVDVLDQSSKDAILAVINLRMYIGVGADSYLDKLLRQSGEFNRQYDFLKNAEELGLYTVFYPPGFGDYEELDNARAKRVQP